MSNVMHDSQSRHELSRLTDRRGRKKKQKVLNEEESVLESPQLNNLLICGNSMIADITYTIKHAQYEIVSIEILILC